MIASERERDALMAHVRSYGHARDRAAHEREMDDHEAVERWNTSAREYLAVIRAMLAPPDDAVLREECVKLVMLHVWGVGPGEDPGRVMPRKAGDAVDAVLAVLERGEATRDE